MQKVALIGVGLLGGSLGLALRQSQPACRVTGYVRREASVLECLKYAVVDDATTDLAKAVADASILVLCTPLGQLEPLAEALLRHLKPGTIITDVGSVKGMVVEKLEPIFARAGCHFVGSHPMAGGEKTGPSAARADLFQNAVCAITPTVRTNPEAQAVVEEMWQSVGARILQLDPQAHDEFVSRSSHLPHVVAAALARLVLDPVNPHEQRTLCASGFRDTTRIASGSPEMWRDISLVNRAALIAAMDQLCEEMQTVKAQLQAGDSAAIEEFYRTAKARRDNWSGESRSPE